MTAGGAVAGEAEVRTALETGLRARFGAAVRVVKLERVPYRYATSSPLDELEVELSDGTALRLLLKDVSPSRLLGAAGDVKPAFVRDPLREIATYRLLLGDEDLGTPVCYGSHADPATGRYWLFLERVDGQELYQIGDLRTWRRVAEWLAAFHTRFAAEADRLAAAHGHLLRYDERYYTRWAARARRHLDAAGIPRQTARSLARVLDAYPRVVERLLTFPTTLIHGEFYASNVLLQPQPGGWRVCAVDWEMAAVGPGLVDLAALTSGGGLSEADRTLLSAAYHQALPRSSGWPRDSDEFLRVLDCCRLHLALQWLGWAPGWTPPREHAQDWAGEALRLGTGLGL